MYWYWWAWVGFVALLVLVPLSYGWGYRRWGPPYPRYYYRRRQGVGGPAQDPRGGAWDRPGAGPTMVTERPVTTSAAEKTWGVIGDLIWLAAFAALVWAVVAWVY